MLKDVVYNPMMQYAINQPCLYNGSGWLALMQGPGSSLGVPSPTNPKWKALPISSLTAIYSSLPAYADFSSIFNDAALESLHLSARARARRLSRPFHRRAVNAAPVTCPMWCWWR